MRSLLAFFAAVAAAQTPDAVYLNGKIVTVDSRFSIAEAIAIGHGRFTAVGKSGAIQRLAGPSTRVIDLHGKTEHFARINALGIFVTVQDHLYLAGPSLVHYWGAARAAWVTPVRAYLDHGVEVAAGTDAPVVPFPPLWTMYDRRNLTRAFLPVPR
jgi:predicted amidohydrolase YtcJ